MSTATATAPVKPAQNERRFTIARAMAEALPWVQDVVVTGDGRGSLGLLVFLAPAAAQLASVSGAAPSPVALADDAGVRAWAQGWLDALAAGGTGSSNRIERLMLMAEPPSGTRGEVTDKGSLNQRAVLHCRAGLVDALYASDRADPRVLHARHGPA